MEDTHPGRIESQTIGIELREILFKVSLSNNSLQNIFWIELDAIIEELANDFKNHLREGKG